MSAHTPPPWSWHGSELLSDSGFILATSRHANPAEADASLIAAAPDLLKAAQDALSDMAWAEKAVPGTNFQASIILLNSAIAKATGAG